MNIKLISGLVILLRLLEIIDKYDCLFDLIYFENNNYKFSKNVDLKNFTDDKLLNKKIIKLDLLSNIIYLEK